MKESIELRFKVPGPVGRWVEKKAAQSGMKVGPYATHILMKLMEADKAGEGGA